MNAQDRRYVLGYAGARLGAGLALWFPVKLFAAVPAYAGFLAALMGACWLLNAWLKYLKSNGTDYFHGFHRAKRQEVPYALRAEKERKTVLSLNGNRHLFEDGLETTMQKPKQLRLDALACLIVAVALLLVSQVL